MTTLAPRTRIIALAVAAVAAPALVVGAASGTTAAHAAAPTCGATITQDTTLTRDVTNCPGVGLRIGADDVTLDLDGHTVSAAAERNPKAHGIFNAGHDGVTIRGGTVRGFGAYGVRLAGADSNVVEDMTLDANFTGIGLVESDRGALHRLTITDAKFVGVNLTGGSLSTVRENTITGANAAGVSVQNSPADPAAGHRIVGNTLERNGIVVQAGPRGVRIVSNTVSGSPTDGIAAFDPSTVLQGNTVSGSGARDVFTPNGVAVR